jgi:hypothetical protein
VKREERALKHWKRLIQGLRIRQRLQEQYGTKDREGMDKKEQEKEPIQVGISHHRDTIPENQPLSLLSSTLKKENKNAALGNEGQNDLILSSLQNNPATMNLEEPQIEIERVRSYAFLSFFFFFSVGCSINHQTSDDRSNSNTTTMDSSKPMT